MTVLYHITSRQNLKSIEQEGLRENSYWASTLNLADFYKDALKSEQDEPVVLSINTSDLEGYQLVPDYSILDGRIPDALKVSKEELTKQWNMTKKTWRDSLEVMQSVNVVEPVPSQLLNVEDQFGNTMRLKDFVIKQEHQDKSLIDQMNTWLSLTANDRYTVYFGAKPIALEIKAQLNNKLVPELVLLQADKEPVQFNKIHRDSHLSPDNYLSILMYWRVLTDTADLLHITNTHTSQI